MGQSLPKIHVHEKPLNDTLYGNKIFVDVMNLRCGHTWEDAP